MLLVSDASEVSEFVDKGIRISLLIALVERSDEVHHIARTLPDFNVAIPVSIALLLPAARTQAFWQAINDQLCRKVPRPVALIGA